MNKDQAWNKLKIIEQTSLLKEWERLSPIEKENLLQQIDDLNVDLFKKQQILISSREKRESKAVIKPFRNYSELNEKDEKIGRQLIAEGKVGSLLIAGGQGSRLRLDGPKGLFPVSVIQNKSLFHLYAEKVLAASHQVNRMIPVAIMTSPLNDAVTRQYFETNQYFGLNPNNVSFFVQGVLPLLNFNGDLFLEEPGKFAEGPDGNGSIFDAFKKSGICEEWQKQGIQYVNVVLIDNALADPLDAYLIGNHFQHQTTVTIKCIERKDENEKVGILIEGEGHIEVREYSELSDSERIARDERGLLKHRCANTSLFCFDLIFMKELAVHTQLPMHLACKAVKFLNEKGEMVLADKPNAWKFEKFIFDALPFAKKTRALLYPREMTFAPLKNFEGEDSVSTVQTLLQKRDREVFYQLTGTYIENSRFELAQDFYYPTEELKQKWKGALLPKSTYILP